MAALSASCIVVGLPSRNGQRRLSVAEAQPPSIRLDKHGKNSRFPSKIRKTISVYLPNPNRLN